MDVLKKIRSSTLIEAMVATVLIVVIFVIASMLIDSLLANTLKGNTHEVETRMNELQYLYANDRITLPYKEEYQGWQLSIGRDGNAGESPVIAVAAIKASSGKQVIRKRIYEK